MRGAPGGYGRRAGGVYVDATFGAGGYTRELLAAADCRVIGIDRDPRAIARGADLVQAAGGRLVLVEGRFSDLEAVARGWVDVASWVREFPLAEGAAVLDRMASAPGDVVKASFTP